jgi:predicted small lipoprotein YifL
MIKYRKLAPVLAAAMTTAVLAGCGSGGSPPDAEVATD